MADTGFTGDTDLDVTRAAIGLAHDGNDRSALEHPYGVYDYRYRGMGGIVTTARDFLKWDRALAQNLILDEAHKRELWTPIKEDYALGWRIARAVNGSVRQYHGGFVRGFPSEFRRYPAENACIALLCNRDDQNCGEIADNLECLLFGRALATPAPKTPILDRAQAESCSGSYAGPLGRLVVRASPGVLMAGVEGDALLEKTGANEKLDWKADATELGRRAVEIVEGIAHGSVDSLRKHMAKSIPPSWPDDELRSIWPAQFALHGAFKSARLVGSRARKQRIELLVAIEYEKGPTNALIAFDQNGLELLDWKGPQFLMSARLQQQSKASFLFMHGDAPAKLDFEFARGKAVAVRLAGQRLSRE
jgi:hypothetical protein